MVEANKKRIIEINQLSFSILHQFFKYENVDIYPRVSINSPLSFLSLSELRSSISASDNGRKVMINTPFFNSNFSIAIWFLKTFLDKLQILLFVLQLESYNLLEVCITVFINSCFLISNLFTLYRIAYNL